MDFENFPTFLKKFFDFWNQKNKKLGGTPAQFFPGFSVCNR
jgi:hypothetical protein